MPISHDLTRNRPMTADGTEYPMACTVSVSVYGDSGTTYSLLPCGSVVLVQYVSAADWATLAPDVAARSPDAPLVSHLDTAGMRDCLRAAAVDSEGD